MPKQTTEEMREAPPEVLERFWAKVEKTPTCWLWTAAIDTDGYGNWSYNKKMTKPHRFSYEIYRGLIPEGLVIDHLCRVRNCVNPDHLRAVTSKVNVLAGIAPSSINARKTHCKRGHEFNLENTRYFTYHSHAKRQCKICEKIHRNNTMSKRPTYNRDMKRKYRAIAKNKKNKHENTTKN